MRSMIPIYAAEVEVEGQEPKLGFSHGDLNALNVMHEGFRLTGYVKSHSQLP